MSKAGEHQTTRGAMSALAKVLLWTLGVTVVLVVAAYITFQVSPWPGALLIRAAFNKGAISTARALAKHVPSGVAAQLDQHYDVTDGDAYLDVFYPSEIAPSDRALLTVVWVHGGGWLSGSKDYIANYARILAGKGYTVVGVDYSLAPGNTYPTPVRQVNTAMGYLAQHATRLHIDPGRFVLAGDSGGAHIAAQLANLVSVPSYATALGIVPSIDRLQLVGVLLYCGPYAFHQANLAGEFGSFLKTVLWSYSGGKDFRNNPRFATASVLKYVTSAFPPTFISVGNNDPLAPQSRAFADALARHGVHVDSLFFPNDYRPALPHEYQFNLDTDAGRLALARSVQFLSVR
jgi:acetyl esterase/lipase